MTGNKSIVFKFADVEVREREFRLVKAGEVLPVEPKTFRVLLYLLRNPQKLIPKEELLNAVWGDAAVTDSSLTRTIAQLRRLLGDEIRNPRYIETVATVGYRFLGKVEASQDALRDLEEAVDSEDLVSGISGLIENGKKKRVTEERSLRWLMPSAAVLAIGLVAAIWYLHRPLPPPRITKFNQITHDGRSKNLGGTDGSRVYFTQLSPRAIAQIGSNGGEVAPVPIASLHDPGSLWDISPDGNTALIATGDEGSLNHPVWSVRILGGALRRLGEFRDAEFSPDGSILFTNLEGDICRIQSDGTDQKKLASPGRGTLDPHMSPDGKVIRFQNQSEVLLEMSPDGTGIHRLLADWKVAGSQWNGRWTPDGSIYLFLVGHPSFEGSQIWALDERRSLFRRHTQPVQLTYGPIRWTGLVPGKDGKTIFAEGQTHRGELSRFDPQAKEFKPFLGGISAEFVSFSRDGKSIVYVSFPDGILWKANRDGSNPVQLTDPPLYPVNPHWSPDGTQILFSDGRSAKIYTVSSEGGSPRRLLSEENEPLMDSDWSPDGKRFVFSRGNFRDLKNEDLRIVDVAGHQVTPIPGSNGFYGPSWSPDGQNIAALAWENPVLRVFDVKTQKWRALSINGSAAFPTFSRDSRYIYFLRYGSDQGVFRIGVNGGNPEKVADMTNWHLTGFWGFSISLDQSNSPLVLRDVGTDDIYALTLDEK